MEMVEVDVELFITCRMCLDEPGVYQIIPSIKELIKYCFDIDTDPFDGLPQLICKKCKSTLSEYHVTKSTFLMKQQKLRERLVKRENHANCNEIIENGNVPTVTPDLPLTSAAPGEPEASVEADTPLESVRPVAHTPSNEINEVNDKWKKNYNERFFCRLCTKSYQRFASIKRHVKTHKKILKKHRKVFRNYCTVQLNKTDSKTNCTGSSNVVVYNSDKIITSKGNSHYHSFYLKKGFSNKGACETEKENSGVKRPGIFFDSSEDEIIKAKKRKTRRLFSSSSTQTVLEVDKPVCNTTNDIIEPGAHIESEDVHPGNAQSINVNDITSDALTKNKIDIKRTIPSKRRQTKANIANYKAIQNIVTMSYQKYIKKVQAKNETQSKSTFSESSLKHKVLSLGRKVIHRQGFECTGLLRYVEHKDLETLWQPNNTSRINQNKSSNFARIMTKLKSRADLENDDVSWKDLNEISFCSGQELDDHINDDNNDSIQTATIETIEVNKPTLQPKLTKEDENNHRLTNDGEESSSSNKFPHKTSVLKQKQQAKNIFPETKPNLNIKESDAATALPTPVNGETEEAEFKDSNLCMPIITSTQSLSTEVNDMDKKKDPVIEKPAPRIKVKPPSELMSQRALNNQGTSEDIWSFNQRQAGLPYHLTNTAVNADAPVLQSQPQHQSNDALVVLSNTQAFDDHGEQDKTNLKDDTNLEYVTLDCIVLPNKKTKFPFLYFKEVLSCHRLRLLDINKELPEHFTCLVTFKLLLKQDTIRPLEVWLSLFCSDSTFCFAFKDTKLRKFDPNQLPAFWQWELLKIYTGEVVKKILHNASKVSKEVHNYTKTFLCLLKSIKCIPKS